MVHPHDGEAQSTWHAACSSCPRPRKTALIVVDPNQSAATSEVAAPGNEMTLSSSNYNRASNVCV